MYFQKQLKYDLEVSNLIGILEINNIVHESSVLG